MHPEPSDTGARRPSSVRHVPTVRHVPHTVRHLPTVRHVPTTARRVPTTVRHVLASVAALAAGFAALAGCGSIGDAQQVVDRARLVNDFAERLSHAGELTYTAEYQLPDGGTASIAQAQRPFRAAYTYPDGKLVVTPERIADCRSENGTTTCMLTALPSAGIDPVANLLGDGSDRGLIAPSEVVGLLTAASLSSNAVIEQHDTTVGGEHATCVDVTGVENAAASSFTACLTGAGVLGSFSGTVDGANIGISLTRFADTAAENAFDLPPGAKIVDKRPR